MVNKMGGFEIGLFVMIAVAVVFLFVSYFVTHYYTYSLQVFYPNHPNITIAQNCSPFMVSASGYLNGKPINPKNTTTCMLPSNIAEGANPFSCNIVGKNITCFSNEALFFNRGNVTWKGTILNASKR